MRYALAALLALVIGSQADAQLIRRYARTYTPGYTNYYSSPSYYYATPTYTDGAVVTSGYYSPYTYSSSYVTPSGYYSSPTVGWNSGYSNYSYGSRYSNGWGWGRRGWRW